MTVVPAPGPSPRLLAAFAALAPLLGAAARGGEAPAARPAEKTSPRESTAAPFAEVGRLCREFRYAEAERVISAFLDAPPEGVSRVDRARFAAYAAVVLLEADLFRCVAERIRTGKRQAILGFAASEVRYTIRAISERGLTVTEGEGELQFAWDRVPDKAAYALLMEVCGDRTSLVERLAVAVFAHHRGMDDARDAELRVAAKLARSPREKDLVDWVRGLLAAVRDETEPSRPRGDQQPAR